MEKAIEIILSQGVSGAVMIIAFMALSKRDKQLLQSLHDRLKDKDRIIEKLLDNELKTDRIIASFMEMKPIMDEIKELLKRIYAKSTGL